jgi:two-component system phosphate regulon sensor histidine kinase PhoR
MTPEIVRRLFSGRSRTAPSGEAPSPHRETTAHSPQGLYERIFRVLPVGVILLGPDRRIRFANAAAAATFGFDETRAPGMHLIQAIPNVELERRVGDALAGEASVGPLAIAGPGESRTYAVAVTPLEAPGESPGVVICSEDRTQFARLERARADLISNVSHELRTPLSSIRLMLETVLSAKDDEASALFLPKALAEVDRLGALVERFLEQARTEAGALRLNLRDIDLEGLAHAIVASFEPQADAKGVHLHVVAARPVRLEADPDRLAQVFVNLIDNALRHTPSGGEIRIELDADGGEAVIRVRDTGVGIPYRDLPRIFERFYVVDRSRTRASGGAGLGLSIVKQIVEAHGGNVGVESSLGRGTSFTVRLPILHLRHGAA